MAEDRRPRFRSEVTVHIRDHTLSPPYACRKLPPPAEADCVDGAEARVETLDSTPQHNAADASRLSFTWAASLRPPRLCRRL